MIEEDARRAMLNAAWDSFGGDEYGGVALGFTDERGVVIDHVKSRDGLRKDHADPHLSEAVLSDFDLDPTARAIDDLQIVPSRFGVAKAVDQEASQLTRT